MLILYYSTSHLYRITHTWPCTKMLEIRFPCTRGQLEQCSPPVWPILPEGQWWQSYSNIHTLCIKMYGTTIVTVFLSIFRPNVQMRPAMRQQLIRPMMARPPVPRGAAANNIPRPQTRNKMPARSPAAAADDGDDDVVLDDDSNDEWLPGGGTGAPSSGGGGGGLPSFANTWRWTQYAAFLPTRGVEYRGRHFCQHVALNIERGIFANTWRWI